MPTPHVSDVNWSATTTSKLYDSKVQGGAKTVFFNLSENDRSDVEFQLSTPEECKGVLDNSLSPDDYEVAIQAMPRMYYDVRAEDQGPEITSFNIKVVVNAASHHAVSAFDSNNIDSIVAKSSEWMGKDCPRDRIEMAYDGAAGDNQLVRIKVVLDNPNPKRRTQILVQDKESRGDFIIGGKEDLKCDARLIISCRANSLWFLRQQCGATIVAKEIYVLYTEPKSGMDFGGALVNIRQEFTPPVREAAAPPHDKPSFGQFGGGGAPSVTEDTMVDGAVAGSGPPPEWATQPSTGLAQPF